MERCLACEADRGDTDVCHADIEARIRYAGNPLSRLGPRKRGSPPRFP
jgi:hypothetical protein